MEIRAEEIRALAAMPRLALALIPTIAELAPFLFERRHAPEDVAVMARILNARTTHGDDVRCVDPACHVWRTCDGKHELNVEPEVTWGCGHRTAQAGPDGFAHRTCPRCAETAAARIAELEVEIGRTEREMAVSPDPRGRRHNRVSSEAITLKPSDSAISSAATPVEAITPPPADDDLDPDGLPKCSVVLMAMGVAEDCQRHPDGCPGGEVPVDETPIEAPPADKRTEGERLADEIKARILAEQDAEEAERTARRGRPAGGRNRPSLPNGQGGDALVADFAIGRDLTLMAEAMAQVDPRNPSREHRKGLRAGWLTLTCACGRHFQYEPPKPPRKHYTVVPKCMACAGAMTQRNRLDHYVELLEREAAVRAGRPDLLANLDG